MSTTETFYAQIFVGLRVGYTDTVRSIGQIIAVCQEYVNEVGLCVTVTPTTYVYKDGRESGAIVGLINHPRFPKSPELLRATALELAEQLRQDFEQNRVSVMFPGETVMLGDAE